MIGPRKPAIRHRFLAALTGLAVAMAIAAGTASFAQSTGYNPYATRNDTTSQDPNSSANGMGGYGGGSSPYERAGPGSSSAGGYAGQVYGGAFSPTVIPNLPDAASRENALTPLTQPDRETGRPGPLYLRPGAAPGEFELFQQPPPEPSEFEKFVEMAIGRPLRRFGSDLVLKRGRGFTAPPSATVPPEYALNPGDEILVGVTGAVEANLRLVIDSEGRVFIPRVGAVNLAGVRYGDLAGALSRRFSEQFKNVRLSVAIGRLHGLNVYVTGYAVSPGAYTVSSLSTMVDAVLAAGGPAGGGSFRTISLRRGGQLIATLDLYDLLLSGDKSHDAVLQNEDVLNIGPVGPEVAVTGSVNAEAIYEARTGETLGDLINYAGGPTSLADDTRVLVARLSDLDKQGWEQLDFAKARVLPIERGDIIRLLSLADVARPEERQAIVATIEGEVDHPGRYYLRPGSTLSDLLGAAGGTTAGAFVFGSEFDRESVRLQQQASFDKAIDNLQLAAAAAPLQSQSGTADQSVTGAARGQAVMAIIKTLRDRKPDGRLVMGLSYDRPILPTSLALENNDRLFIPPQPKTVGVFGAVYQAGSFLYRPGARIGDYLKESGGPQKIADLSETFVVRADGAVASAQSVHGLNDQPALPGDVIFVSVRTSKSAWERLLEVSALIYQLGIGVLTLKVLGL